ncbi:MAG TPA: hypothetical protein EYP04_00460 [Anaerolineae bacterium]|nr:hypothetical protein [Anaerolineae bacterium]
MPMGDEERESPAAKQRWPGLRLLMWTTTVVLLAVVAIFLLRRGDHRAPGSVDGLPPVVKPVVGHPLGVNIELTQYDEEALAHTLDDLAAAGFRWLRQRFPWAEIEPQRGDFDWSPWDRIVTAAHQRGFRLIAVLDTSPRWARWPRDADNPFAPPHERADFGRFAAAFAQRYGQQIDYYQIWNEPNIAPHWGAASVDPADYAGLLREGFYQIKAADPDAVILLAALAPNVETGGANLSDIRYLEELYHHHADAWFDVMAAEPYGFDDPPDAPPDPQRLNFARVAFLRKVMRDHGDESTPVWVVAYGWNALPSGWTGASSLWGQVTEAEQAAYAQAAVEWARREWPWLGLMAWAAWQPAVPPDDPWYGFALVDADGRPRPVLVALQTLTRAPPVAYPGHHRPDDPAVHYEGGWRVTPLAADIGTSGDRIRFSFVGTRLDLRVHRGPYWAYLVVTVDGRPANRLPRDREGNAYLILYDPQAGPATVTLAQGLSDGLHQAEIVAQRGWGQWAIEEFIVSRETPGSPWRGVGIGLLILAGLALLGLTVHLFTPTGKTEVQALASLGQGAATPFYALPDSIQVACIVAVALAFALSRWLPLDILTLAGLGAGFLLRPDIAPPLIAASLPFYVSPKPLMGHAFSLTELFTLTGVAALLVRWTVRCLAGEQCRLRLMLRGLDWPLLAWGGVVALSMLAAEHKDVALREFRVVIVESLLFYVLITRVPAGRARSFHWMLADGLVLGALVVSSLGLWQFASGHGVITAEGVRRVRALYGSPNNLGLYLDRVVPLLLAVVLYGRERRRLVSGLTLLPVATACLLTFSRGALLLGLPATVLFLGVAGTLTGSRRQHSWWPLAIALGLLVAGGLALLPFWNTERFARLLDASSGTTFLRLQLWQGSWHMIRDHLWLGVGPDNFLYAYRTRYALPTAWEELNLSHPHNLVLDAWSRTGLIGLLTLGWLLIAGWRRGWRLWQRLSSANERALVLGLLGGLVAALTHGLIDNSFFLVDLAFLFMLALGVFRRNGLQQALLYHGKRAGT